MPTVDETAQFLKKAAKVGSVLNPLTAGPVAASVLAPDMAKSLMTLPQRSFEASEAHRQGYGFDPGPNIETALMMMGARAPTIKPGELGNFGGRFSKTADLRQLKLAEAMEKEYLINKFRNLDRPLTPIEKYDAIVGGIDFEREVPLGMRHAGGGTVQNPGAKNIYNETGWFRAPDLKWRYSLPDYRSQAQRLADTDKAISLVNKHGSAPLTTFKHPSMFDAYPEMKKYYVQPIAKDSTYYGQQFPGMNKITSIMDTPARTGGVIAHEGMHGIQDLEGFAPGANPDWVLDKYLRTKHPELLNKETGKFKIEDPVLREKMSTAAQEAYTQFAGEQEARAANLDFLYPEVKNKMMSGPAGVYKLETQTPLFPDFWLKKQLPANQEMLKAVMQRDTAEILKPKPPPRKIDINAPSGWGATE